MIKFILSFINSSTKSITIGNNNDKLILTPLSDENGKSVMIADVKDVVVVEEAYSDDDEDPDYLTLIKISYV